MNKNKLIKYNSKINKVNRILKLLKITSKLIIQQIFNKLNKATQSFKIKVQNKTKLIVNRKLNKASQSFKIKAQNKTKSIFNLKLLYKVNLISKIKINQNK